jgi:hypothetical protein
MKPGALVTTTLLAVLMATGTWMVGWWAVPMVAAAWGMIFRPTRPWLAGLAGSVAWGAVLVGAPWDALRRLTPRLGGIFHLPGWGMLALTLGFVWLLGWSAARVGAGAGATLRAASTTGIPAGTG